VPDLISAMRDENWFSGGCSNSSLRRSSERAGQGRGPARRFTSLFRLKDHESTSSLWLSVSLFENMLVCCFPSQSRLLSTT